MADDGRARLRQDARRGRMGDAAGERSARCGSRLVGATIDEARSVMIEGESGLLTVARRKRARLKWEPSLGRLTWPQGSVASCFRATIPMDCVGPSIILPGPMSWPNGARPRRRGTICRWAFAAGLRPRALVTTTPRRDAAAGADPRRPVDDRDGRPDERQYQPAEELRRRDDGDLRRDAAGAAGTGRRADRRCRGGAVAEGVDREDAASAMRRTLRSTGS